MPQAFDEQAFQQWYKTWAASAKMDPNPDDPQHQYDYRAAYKAGVQAPKPGEHWPSKFKMYNHPNRFVDGKDTMLEDYLFTGTNTPKQARN